MDKIFNEAAILKVPNQLFPVAARSNNNIVIELATNHTRKTRHGQYRKRLTVALRYVLTEFRN